MQLQLPRDCQSCNAFGWSEDYLTGTGLSRKIIERGSKLVSVCVTHNRIIRRCSRHKLLEQLKRGMQPFSSLCSPLQSLSAASSSLQWLDHLSPEDYGGYLWAVSFPCRGWMVQTVQLQEPESKHQVSFHAKSCYQMVAPWLSLPCFLRRRRQMEPGNMKQGQKQVTSK